MADYRQKREDGAATASSDVDFRRGLEELFRGHLDGCMGAALASCSSARGESDEDDDGAGHDRRRRRSEVDAEDLAESSAARRRHSRILSRWVARQAEEMITTMERRNRESELMALAGLHTVSMLDSSFLRETRRSAGSVAAERRPVSASAFSILQRWRELEDEAGRRERRGMATGRVEDRAESLSRMDSIESDENEYGQWPRGTAGTLRAQREEEDDDEMNRSSREPSPDLGEVERERVRQIVRGWMTERGLTDHGAPMPSPRNDSPRAEWLGETERERVRLVREWVQMASQQRDARAIRREEREREDQHGSRASSVTDHEDGQPEHVRRDLLRLRGRQARLELITRSARERQRELQNLSEHRAVTDFAHRNRIQSFLRGRFLRNGRPSEEERAPSVAARELGQLRQRHPVSGLREGFRYRLESIVRSQASNQSEASTRNQNGSDSQQSLLNVGSETRNANNEQPQPRNDDTEFQQMAGAQTSGEGEGNTNINNLDQSVSASQERNWQEEMTENDERDWEHTTETGLGEWNRDAGEGPDGNWQDHIDREWPQDHSGNEIESEQRTPEAHGNWHEDEMNVTAEQWQDDHSEPSRSDQPASMRRINTFIPPDDDNVYSMELRELLSRRSVSNLLSSGFRESLDQLIQSYVQRQGRDPMDWDFQQNLQNPDMPEINQDERDNTNRNQQDSVAGPARVLPVPPVPPPQPIWHRELRHSHWARNSMHRSEIEWDTINDLRADMARLQQGMSHMQRMLETCMEMQLELQRSVRQEVSAALNRNLGGKGDDAESSNGLKWSHVRKGICCVCCDTQIDSLLYRCGHMCSCSKCANELVRSGGKCPLCRAPIVEVIRAYSIL